MQMRIKHIAALVWFILMILHIIVQISILASSLSLIIKIISVPLVVFNALLTSWLISTFRDYIIKKLYDDSAIHRKTFDDLF